MNSNLEELKSRWLVIDNLDSVSGYLRWDQLTHMPKGGAESRARLIATIDRLAHEHLTDPQLGRLLDDLADYAEELDHDSDEASMIRVARRDYERWTKIPSEFFEELSLHASKSYEAWKAAREDGDFGDVELYLEKMLELSRRYSEFLGPFDHVADPLVSQFNPGVTTETLRTVFASLRPRLVALLDSIESAPQVDTSLLKQSFSLEQQHDLVDYVASCIGFDFEHGRQDETAHPFTTVASPTDVRITTRYKRDDLTEALFSTIHEAGHGMYEQRIPREFEGTPLSHGASSAVHESQSRLWENIVGRSRPFCSWILPHLRERFPTQLGNATEDDLYRAVNVVTRSLIRTDADEVSYNLHIMIRFDLEIQMLEGDLAVHDLPDAWNSRYEADLVLRPPDDSNGVLQDVHWFSGLIGVSFHGYTLGNILSGQLFDAAISEDPTIPEGIEQGNFGPLHDWLAENVYRYGRKFTADELISLATGHALDAEPYLEYLDSKFSSIYDL